MVLLPFKRPTLQFEPHGHAFCGSLSERSDALFLNSYFQLKGLCCLLEGGYPKPRLNGQYAWFEKREGKLTFSRENFRPYDNIMSCVEQNKIGLISATTFNFLNRIEFRPSRHHQHINALSTLIIVVLSH